MHKNIIKWMQILLKERLSNDLNLEFKNEQLFLTANGCLGLIIFDELQKNFLEFKSNLNCTKWDPKSEGLFSIPKIPLFAPTSITLKRVIIERKRENYLIHYDIFGLAYWTLNRLEEVENKNLDKFKRFNFKYSHAYNYKYLDQPIIDYWFDILSQVVKKLWPKINLKKSKFMINLSHDVDRPSVHYCGKNFHSYLRNIASRFVHGNIKDYKKILKSYLSTHRKKELNDPYNTFEWIMNLAEENDLKSTFNFIFGGSHFRDGYYSMENKKIKTLINLINNRKHYIGIHLSYNCFNKKAHIIDELRNFHIFVKSNNIKQDKIISRMHYLKWKAQDTLVYLNNAGVDIDTSLGYSGYAGFRCGTCLPYTGFDPLKNQLLDIKVSPLILMDTTLTSNPNFKLDDAYNIGLNLKNKCKEVNGQFTLLWHNCNLIDNDYKELLRSLLKF